MKKMEIGKEVDMVNQTTRPKEKKKDGADKMSGKNVKINNHIWLITVAVACEMCNNLVSMFPLRFQSLKKADKHILSAPSVTKSLLGQQRMMGPGEGRGEAVWPFQLLRLTVLGSQLMSHWKSRVVGRCWAHKVALCAYRQCWSRTCTLTQIWAKLNFLPKWHTSTWVSKLAAWLYKTHKDTEPTKSVSSLLFASHVISLWYVIWSESFHSFKQ